ncbi:YybH family protein [Bradyrhizobium centrosematis]|uniref:YybH family protein n=1 Tax=Bradyrhizobium centrosematis TaxID=1300039 RepID=UPI00216986EE|nr:nuclear transport factor 2 family protein [Bradyrhizobium centrosematis]MCS3763344.1 ketosteroid isomerase-like protein [Bradyrhizobium centrosematis]MCS3776011.1 ketosteroid isomerase-like protein [Bradyrhizobium centrosematis]
MTKKTSRQTRSASRQQKLSRRAIMAAAAAVPLVQLSADAAAGPEVTANLIERARRKNAAFMRGDMDSWLELVRIAPDFTLMQPFGGPASHGFDASPKRLADLSRYFREGETDLEVVQTLASDALVVLVMVEHQRAEVGGLAAQDWSLRITEVYRKDGMDWQLVHRHADPLVRSVTLQQAALLARGGLEKE